MNKNTTLAATAVVVLLGAYFRLYMSIGFYSTVHNDEYIKTLDIENYLRTGTGWCSFEFRPPGGVYQMSDGRTTEAFTASNSHIWPLLFYGLRDVCSALGVTYPQGFYMAHKILVAFNSSLLPWAVFLYAQVHAPGRVGAGFLAALWVATDDWLIWMGSHALINSFVAPWVFLALWATSRGGPRWALCGGFGLGILTYIRPDTALIALLHSLLLFDPHRVGCIAATVVGGLLGLVVGGGVDAKYYGAWFISPFNWFTFNVLEGHASTTFGTSPPHFYWSNVLSPRSHLVLALAVSLLIALITSLDSLISTIASSLTPSPNITHPSPLASSLRCHRPSCVLNKLGWSRMWVMTAALFLVYSRQGHKEQRFVHQVYVLAIVLACLYIDYAADKLASFLARLRNNHGSDANHRALCLRVAGVSLLLVSALVTMTNLHHIAHNPDQFRHRDGYHKALMHIANDDPSTVALTSYRLDAWLGFVIAQNISVVSLERPPWNMQHMAPLREASTSHVLVYEEIVNHDLERYLHSIGFHPDVPFHGVKLFRRKTP